MKSEIKRLREIIKSFYPYKFYLIIRRIFLLLGIVSFIAMITFCIIEPQPVPFDGAGETQYAYLNIDFISNEDYQGYYLVQTDESVYIYHQQDEVFGKELADLQEGRRGYAKIFGTPNARIDDEILGQLIPIFNSTYDMSISSVKELVTYTGNDYLDNDIVSNSSQIGLTLILSTFFLIFYGLVYLIEAIWNKRLKSNLETLCYKGDDQRVINQLQYPVHVFNSLKVVLLPDYFVCNHPVPFAINYKDIMMIYETHVLSKEIRLYIYNRDFNKINVLVASSLIAANHDEMKELLGCISTMNSRILVGDTSENMSILHQMKDSY